MACRARISEIRPESRSAAPNVSIWPSTWRCNELLSTWFSMVDGRAGVAHNELAHAWMQCWMRICAARRCCTMPWAAAASCSVTLVVGMAHSSCAFAIVSSDMTAHASCFHEGLLRIALWSPDACCWSLSSCVPAEGGYIGWYAMSLAACCVICAKKLRGGQPNPVR